MRDRFVLLAPRGSEALVDRAVEVEELVELPLICGTYASTATEYVSATFLQRGLVFQPKFTFDQIGIAASFVRKGLDVVIQPYLGITPLLDLEDFRLCEIIDGPVRPVGVVRRKGHPLSKIAEKAQ